MKSHNRIIQRLSRWVLLSFALSIALPTQAQPIQTDNTLGTQVNPRGTTFVITGGTTVNTNLFHSFSRFDVPQGAIAEFRSAPTIANILARVTGGQRSEINGLIQSLGSANLFLINPQGILFGAEARLNLGGSFVGTTANAIQFPNGGEFSPTSSAQTPLLSVNPSALLFTQLNPAPIENRSISLGTERIPDTRLPVEVRGLSVPAGKSLLLVGGNVRLDGGRLNALRGRVELAGVAGEGAIALTQDANQRLALSPLPNAITRGNVTLVNQAQINLATATGRVGPIRVNLGSIGGDVALQAGTIAVEGSNIASGTIGSEDGGTILMNAAAIFLKNSQITSQTNQSGNAGNVLLSASKAIRIENSSLLSPTKSRGEGGDIRIVASELSAVDGRINAGTEGSGNAGGVFIQVANDVRFDRTTLSTGGQLAQNLVGSSGDVTIQAGSLALNQNSRVFSSNAGENSAGKIDLQIQGGVSLTGGSQISSEALNNGRGGDIALNAQSLEITDSFVRSATFGQGNAGNIQATVRDRIRIQVDQVDEVAKFPYPVGMSASTNSQGAGGKIAIAANQVDLSSKPGARSGLFAAATSSGASGTIEIDAPEVRVRDGAQISVSSSNPQTGQAGNLTVIARSLSLDQNAKIIAETASGKGGNIRLQLSDALVLRRSSLISTTAGTAQAGGDGGNIAIARAPDAQRAPFLIAVPSEDSNIQANAFTGSGGVVTIEAEGLFGIQAQQRATDQSDITASSESGPQGTVSITPPDVDPRRGLIELPATVVDASNQIAQACAPQGKQVSSLVATGRGGLPLNPGEPLRDRSTITGWVSVDANLGRDLQIGKSETRMSSQIREATGWVKDAKGQVVLVAQTPVASTPIHPCLKR